jgi:hypothetical protein
MSVKNFKRLDWEAIAALARHNNAIELSASEDQAELVFREVTPELLLEVLQEAGANVDVVRDEDGAIDEIHARASVPLFEGDTVLESLRASGTSRLPFIFLDGVQGILERIEATGPTPSKILGDLAQTSVDQVVNATCSTTTGQTAITFTAAPGVSSGSITGTGIPANATVTINGTTGTLSAAATATGSGVAVVITGETQVIGLAEWTLSWKRKTADATTTDDDTYESSLGSTASWSVKAKYIFIDGDTSQSTNILATITAPQSSLTWNFFPTIGTGRAAFSGQAYVDGIDIATGMGKVVGLDVSLKGTGKLNSTVQLAPISNPNTGTGQQAEV